MTVWKADGGRPYQAGLMENQTRPTVPFHGVALNLHFPGHESLNQHH